MQNLPPNSLRVIDTELDLKMYARLLWQWAWLIILCLTVAAVSAYVISLYTTPIYQATSTILIDEAQSSGSLYPDIVGSERKARTYAEWMQREQTLSLVAQELGTDPSTLSTGVTAVRVTPLRDTQLIQVAVEGIWPEVIAAVANALPPVFVREVIVKLQDERYAEVESSLLQQIADLDSQIELAEIKIDALGDSRTAAEEIELTQLHDELTQKQAMRDPLRASLDELRLAKAQSSDSIIVVESAKVPDTPIRPRVLNNTLLAAVVGAMLALGLIFLIEYLDDRLKSPQEVIALADAPVLGTIPAMPRASRKPLGPDEVLFSFLQPRHPITEAYRTLRTNLQFSSVDTTVDSLVITSAKPSEGKTTTAANLAVVLAQSGKQVVLVDADLRRPKVHLTFNLPQSPGLTEALLAGGESVQGFLHTTVVPNLQVITSGEEPPNPAELLGSQRLRELLANLRQQADVIIWDAPPLLPITDAQVLAGVMKNVLLVVELGRTQRSVVVRAYEALQHVGARMLGVALNNVRRTPHSSYYYEYGDYYGKKAGAPKKTGAATAVTEKELTHSSALGLFHKREAQGKENGAGAQPQPNGKYHLQETEGEEQ